MSKKLVSLVLVFALTGMVSAIQWVKPDVGPPGYWDIGSNWDAGREPIDSDATVKLQPNDGINTANIIVRTAASGGSKIQITSFAAKVVQLEILNNSSLRNSGSVDGYTGSFNCTIDAEGVWNACTNTGTFKMASNTAAGVANSVAVDVYGTLNIKGTSGSTLAMVNDSRSGTSGTNYATVNIHSNGLVDVDAYAIGIYGTGRINFSGNGKMMVKNDVTSQVNADILAGRITGVTTADVRFDSGLNKTIIGVPEPATLALFGLGALLLRRKR